MALAVLDKPLNDLRREITNLRQENVSREYDTNKLSIILSRSKDSLKETETSQQQLLHQLQQFEISLVEINQVLRANSEQKAQLDQHQRSGSIDFFV